MTPAERWITPNELARRWGVNGDKILQFIRSGELKAANFATRLDGKPRYKIAPSEVIRFETARTVQPPAPKTPRRRKAATKERTWF